MPQTFYRVIAGPTATRGDFLSMQAQGRALREPASAEARRAYTGISVFDSAARARDRAHELAQRGSPLGTHLVAVTIPDGSGVRAERTFARSPGHYTLWGDPDELLRYAGAVTALGEGTGDEDDL